MYFLGITFVILTWSDVALSRWIACTDYTVKNGYYWNPKMCRGYPRDASTFAKKNQFGVDLGFDHKPQNRIRTCKTGFTSKSYTWQYPKAVYYPGQQVILAHPMKGAGAASCTNKWIPDHGSKILRGRKGKDGNRFYNFYLKTVVADLGASPYGDANVAPDRYPKTGYQNAPKFCENQDRALATYSFNVPLDLEEGSYTFVWSWAYNHPNDVYTTCFDVIIAANKTARDDVLKKRKMSLSVPCGGFTSDGSRGSRVGCAQPPIGTTFTTQTYTIDLTSFQVKTTTAKRKENDAKKATTSATTTEKTTTKATTATPISTTASLSTTTTILSATTPLLTTSVLTTTPKSATTAASVTATTASNLVTTPTAKLVKTNKTVTPTTAIQSTAPVTTKAKTPCTEATPAPLIEKAFTARPLQINGYQLSGTFKVGIPPSKIRRRWFTVKFNCDIEAVQFYNARVMRSESKLGKFIVLQEGGHVTSGKIEFFIAFNRCPITRRPRVALLYEE